MGPEVAFIDGASGIHETKCIDNAFTTRVKLRQIAPQLVDYLIEGFPAEEVLDVVALVLA